MALVALAVLLNGQFNRRGHWKRMLMAGIIAGLVALAGIGLRNVVVKHPMLIPLMYLSVIGAAAAAMTSLFVDSKRFIPSRPLPQGDTAGERL